MHAHTWLTCDDKVGLTRDDKVGAVSVKIVHSQRRFCMAVAAPGVSILFVVRSIEIVPISEV